MLYDVHLILEFNKDMFENLTEISCQNHSTELTGGSTGKRSD